MLQEQINISKKNSPVELKTVINITGLWKSFGKNNAILKGIDLTVQKGENLVVLGKSGSGKSVAIKCMVGLIKPDEGTVKLFDTDIASLKDGELNAIRVKVGFLFQNSALYDSMTVRENLEFPLRRHWIQVSQKQSRILLWNAWAGILTDWLIV